jgi:hypothetical protein
MIFKGFAASLTLTTSSGIKAEVLSLKNISVRILHL